MQPFYPVDHPPLPLFPPTSTHSPRPLKAIWRHVDAFDSPNELRYFIPTLSVFPWVSLLVFYTFLYFFLFWLIIWLFYHGILLRSSLWRLPCQPLCVIVEDPHSILLMLMPLFDTGGKKNFCIWVRVMDFHSHFGRHLSNRMMLHYRYSATTPTSL